MAKMWAGRFIKEEKKEVNDFNSSISFDYLMYESDIIGSIAHVHMLANQNIISKEDSSLIESTLLDILEELKNNKLQFNLEAEDIHMFIEEELTKRIGDVGKRLHTSRSRNDQVAVDIRLHLRSEIKTIKELVKQFITTLVDIADNNKETIMPGYTHLQRAQPITLANHMLAYCYMLKRDIERLNDTNKRLNYNPLGSCALAGTTYNIDRDMTSKELGFTGPTKNSLDGVSDRDFVVELNSSLSILMMHLSRLSEEIILWSSAEFKFVELDDAYSTGSSIMPQKKNPDILELIRGKTGRVYGDLINILTVLKGIPLAYNKDMQEDKEAVFDAVKTVKMCLSIINDTVKTMKFNKDKMLYACKSGFINATDLADYLVKKGMPFRSAYKISGSLVSYAISNNTILEDIPLNVYKEYSPLFDEDLYKAIDIYECTFKRTSLGASGIDSVNIQIKDIRGFLYEV